MQYLKGVSLPQTSGAWAGRISNDMLFDVCISAFCILPLLLTAHLPLGDLPNHLARQYVIRDLPVSAYLKQFYFVHWALVPNLALEIFVFFARHVMGIDTAVRAFCISTLLMLFYGTRLINLELSHGQARFYRIVPLLCYGGPFQYGFLSFCFGIGLALLAFGVWLRFRYDRLILVVAVFAPVAFLLLLCHLAAFGLFALAVGAFTLTESLSQSGEHLTARVLQGQVRVACWLVPPFLLFMVFSPTAGAGHGMQFSTLREKIESVAAITWFSVPILELSLLVLALLGAGSALATGIVRIRREGLTILAAQGIAWLALPRVAMGGGFIDYRLPWAISFFALASVVPGLRPGRLAVPLGWLAAGLVFLRVTSICVLWLSWEPILAGIDDALSTLPLGARLMVVIGQSDSTSHARQPLLDNVPAYAVARRQVFMPYLFASIPGHILEFQPHYKQPWHLPPATLDHVAPDYDYVLVLRPSKVRISPSLPLVCQRSGREFILFAIEPPVPMDSKSKPDLSCR